MERLSLFLKERLVLTYFVNRTTEFYWFYFNPDLNSILYSNKICVRIFVLFDVFTTSNRLKLISAPIICLQHHPLYLTFRQFRLFKIFVDYFHMPQSLLPCKTRSHWFELVCVWSRKTLSIDGFQLPQEIGNAITF